jgi:hypothetical protein
VALIGWIDPDLDASLIENLWADVPLDTDTRDTLLLAAFNDCATFAGTKVLPAEPADAEKAASYRTAQIMQARARQRSFVAGSGDQLGTDFPVTVFPMDWSVKSLLRPRPGIPGMF